MQDSRPAPLSPIFGEQVRRVGGGGRISVARTCPARAQQHPGRERGQQDGGEDDEAVTASAEIVEVDHHILATPSITSWEPSA